MVQFHPVPIYILLPILIMKSIIPLPPLEVLQAQLIYNPTTGRLTRKSTGNELGVNSKRYIIVRINGLFYQAHRLIYKLMTGKDPVGVINHKNENKADNTWSNLENITQAANLRYSLRGTGVYWNKKLSKWVAGFQFNKQKIYLGVFNNKADAAAAVKAWKEENTCIA